MRSPHDNLAARFGLMRVCLIRLALCIAEVGRNQLVQILSERAVTVTLELRRGMRNSSPNENHATSN